MCSSIEKLHNFHVNNHGSVHGVGADEVNGKAGNLNHALREVYPRGAPVHPGEVVAVFDCDQARARCFPPHTVALRL